MDNLSDIMQYIAKNGYKARTYDYVVRVQKINEKLSDLNSEELETIEEQIDFLLKRHRILSKSPTIAEQPALADDGHARCTAPHGQAGGRRIKIGLGVMCEYDDDAPEPEGTVIFDSFPKIGDEVMLPSDGKVWIVTRIDDNPYSSYPIRCKEKPARGRDG